MKQAAGIIVYRRDGNRLEVLLVHPSGNYNRHKPWSIPKGLPDEGESLEAAARREVREEAGIDVPCPLAELGHIDYTRSRKRVHGFAVEAPPDAAPHPASWEVDRAEFLSLADALAAVHPEQRPLLQRLATILGADNKRD